MYLELSSLHPKFIEIVRRESMIIGYQSKYLILFDEVDYSEILNFYDLSLKVTDSLVALIDVLNTVCGA